MKKNKLLLSTVLLSTLIASCSKEIQTIDEVDINAAQTNGMISVGKDSLYYYLKDSKFYLDEDVYLTPSQFRKLSTISDTSTIPRGLTITDMDLLWTNGNIPYTIRSDFQNPQRIYDAINLINTETHLNLVPRNGETDYIEFVPITGTTSYSALGRVGSRQLVEISSVANYGTVIHEIFHAAGLMHEHQRSDAWLDLQINYDNIRPEWEDQFTSRAGNNIGPFNVNSIMNYSSYYSSEVVFDTSIPVLLLKNDDGSTTAFNANRDSIAYTDKLALQFLYAPKDTRELRTAISSTTVNEAYTTPSEDIYDVSTRYRISFYENSTSTALLPLNNFMNIRVYFYERSYGQGPENLQTFESFRDIIAYPGQTEAYITLSSRQHTHLGYYQPGTYIEEFRYAQVSN